DRNIALECTAEGEGIGAGSCSTSHGKTAVSAGEYEDVAGVIGAANEAAADGEGIARIGNVETVIAVAADQAAVESKRIHPALCQEAAGDNEDLVAGASAEVALD